MDAGPPWLKGDIVGTILYLLATGAGLGAAVWLFVRMDRVNRQRIELRRAAWKAEGREGEPPLNYLGGSAP